MIQLGQQGHLHSKTVELEKVKRNRTALDINPTKSSVLSHSCASGHKVDFDDFKILSCCSDSYELMIHNKYKPTLTVQGSSIPLNLF